MGHDMIQSVPENDKVQKQIKEMQLQIKEMQLQIKEL